MKTPELHRFDQAAALPDAWDDAADAYFQKRAFLRHAEAWNPCGARYYLLSEQGRFLVGAVVYTLRINLFTFSRRSLELPMQVVGLPASVSAPGLFGVDPRHREALLQALMTREKGLILGLNFDPATRLEPGIPMTMLPSIRVERRFADWNDYLEQLRAPYRRRLKRMEADFHDVQTERTSCSAFTAEHHALYLQIMRRTPSKLETLSEAYFRELPDNFRLTSARRDGQLLCWHITCTDGNNCWFFFGGHDYAQNNPNQSYYNNLRLILREAVEGGYGWIDLGQTAEIPKLKMGAAPDPKTFFVYHRNPLYHTLLRLAKPLITYRVDLPDFHVYKHTP